MPTAKRPQPKPDAPSRRRRVGTTAARGSGLARPAPGVSELNASGSWRDTDEQALAELAVILAPHARQIARAHAKRLAVHVHPHWGRRQTAVAALEQLSAWLFDGMFLGLRRGQVAKLFDDARKYDLALLRSQRAADPELRSTLTQLYMSLEIATALVLDQARQRCATHPRLPEMLAAYGRFALHLGHILAETFHQARSQELRDALRVSASLLERLDAETHLKHQLAGAARDGERRRLARELHDGTLQDLSALKLRLEAAFKRDATAALPPVIDGIVALMHELRRVVDDLRPPGVSDGSLSAAIADHARVLTCGQAIALALDLPEATLVADWATRDVYRIAQEAIGNAVRHAAPTHVWVQLARAGGGATLAVRDDGAGFDVRTAGLAGGIVGMRERAAALGGDLDITTAPGCGTLVRLSIPPTVCTQSPAGEPRRR